MRRGLALLMAAAAAHVVMNVVSFAMPWGLDAMVEDATQVPPLKA